MGLNTVRVLPLRVGGLAPEVGVAGDGLGRQAARHARIGRQAGDAVGVERARAAERRRVLAGRGARPAEAHLEERRRRGRPRGAHRELLVGDVGLAVATPARRQRQRRVVEDVHVAVAEAPEGREARREREIHLAVALSVVVLEELQRAVVVRGAGRSSSPAARRAPCAPTPSSGSACRPGRSRRSAGCGRPRPGCPGAEDRSGWSRS